MTTNENSSSDPLAALYDETSSVDHILSEERYTHREFIAEGAIKKVYKVTDTHCERDVALACIKPELLTWQQSLEFIREVQLTSRFEHPHIVRVYDIEVHDGTPWFTMELTSGLNLRDWVEKNELSLNQKLNIISNICDAMEYAHAQDVLHLDLKPENISMGAYGQVLIVDWGIAAALSKEPIAPSSDQHTLLTHIKGTPGYMPPEQASENYTPSEKSDIFGIGALFYFLLTGEAPIQGDTTNKRLSNTVAKRFKNLDHPSIPQRIQPIIEKCLSHDPAGRYNSVAALNQDIQRYRDGFASLAESPPLTTLLKLFIQRHKTSCLLTLCFFILSIAATYAYIHAIHTREEKAKIAKNEALTLLQQLQSKEEELQTQRDAYAIDLLHRARATQYRGAIGTAYKAILTAHQLAPENTEIQHQLGILSFLTQRFDQADTFITKDLSHRRAQRLRNLAKQHAALPSKQSAKLIPETFKALCKRDRSPTASHFFLYDTRRSSKERHAQLVKILIEHDNGLTDMHFSWNPKTQTLNLSGNPRLKTLLVPFTNYAPRYNMLQGLPVRTLILDDTPHLRSKTHQFRPNKHCSIEFKKV